MSPNTLVIRESDNRDTEAIVTLHLAAFGEAEGEEVSMLARELLCDPSAEPVLSLVAEQGDELLGNVLFTAVRIGDGNDSVTGQILAPLGVAPSAQGTGIGGRLVRAGLERLGAAGIGLVFVLGHPGYYPRFGFEPAGRLGLQAPYPIPEEHADAWMVLELGEGNLGRVHGTVHCCDALDRPGDREVIP